MKKTEAINQLGGTAKKAAEAMGYQAVQTIYLWPEVLPQATADRVAGAVARLKLKTKPKQPIPHIQRTQEAIKNEAPTASTQRKQSTRRTTGRAS